MQFSNWRENSTRILGPGKDRVLQNLHNLDYSNLPKIQFIESKKYFYSRQLTHNETVDNTSQVHDCTLTEHGIVLSQA